MSRPGPFSVAAIVAFACSRELLLVGSLLALQIGFAGAVRAQGADSDLDIGWSNSTDLSVVVAKGNADTESFGLDNTLKRHWKRSNFSFEVDIFQTNEADDRFLLIESGLTWLPGETPPSGGDTIVVEPPVETEASRLFVEGKYDHEFRERLFWSTGASWDRNEDAGILNRYIAFGGLGRVWWKREDLEFRTVWAISYTDREEDAVDSKKDERFGGVRFSTDYLNKWGKLVVYENGFKANMNMRDRHDYSLDMTNTIKIDINHRLTLKIGLQTLFESEPALEDVDVVARVILVDPDGVPASGDEFFETVDTGGFKLVVSDGRTRKEGIDEIFKTSIVIRF